MKLETTSADFSDEQKRYLEGFMSGLQVGRVGRSIGVAAGTGAPAGKVDPAIDMKTPVREQVNALSGVAYFRLLAELLKTNPPAAADAPMLKKLAQIGIVPDAIDPADLDEMPLADELPPKLAERLAAEKAKLVAARHPGAFVLGAVIWGETDEIAIAKLERLGALFSTGVAVENLTRPRPLRARLQVLHRRPQAPQLTAQQGPVRPRRPSRLRHVADRLTAAPPRFLAPCPPAFLSCFGSVVLVQAGRRWTGSSSPRPSRPSGCRRACTW